MNDTETGVLMLAVARLADAERFMQEIEDSLARTCSDIVETGLFDYEEGSVFADDVASLENFHMEFDVLIRTAQKLKRTFGDYRREGYADHATV